MVFGTEMAKANEDYKPVYKKDRKFNVNIKDPGGGVALGGEFRGRGRRISNRKVSVGMESL